MLRLGYDRIAGALANLGHNVSDQTVGNVLRRHGIAPAPKRGQTTAWKDFIAAHMAVLAGRDFTWRGPATYYLLSVVFGPCFAPEAWNRYGFRRVLQI